jgi:hypothetical protein
MGELRVMGQAGDTKLMWDPDKPEEVEHVRRMFVDMTAKGYNAYSVKEKGEQGEVVKTFDPKAAKLILAPPMRGG